MFANWQTFQLDNHTNTEKAHIQTSYGKKEINKNIYKAEYIGN
jgi:hypothetical protein